MRDLLRDQVKELRRITRNLDQIAEATPPGNEIFADVVIRRVRAKAKDIQERLSGRLSGSGGISHKLALQGTQLELEELAKDLTSWIATGVEPVWAEGYIEKADQDHESASWDEAHVGNSLIQSETALRYSFHKPSPGVVHILIVREREDGALFVDRYTLAGQFLTTTEGIFDHGAPDHIPGDVLINMKAGSQSYLDKIKPE